MSVPPGKNAKFQLLHKVGTPGTTYQVVLVNCLLHFFSRDLCVSGNNHKLSSLFNLEVKSDSGKSTRIALQTAP